MRTNAPKFVTRVIAVILGVLGILGARAGITGLAAYATYMLAAAFIILALATVLKDM